jgi:hypothetical protein
MGRELIEECIDKLETWVEQKEYKSYEPFDGLSSFLRPLTFNNVFAERLLQQFVRQTPINIRPIIGIKPLESTKGRGFMAWGYLKLQVTRNLVGVTVLILRAELVNYQNMSQ